MFRTFWGGVLLFVFAGVLQSGLFSGWRLLHGTPDAVLLAWAVWVLYETRYAPPWAWALLAGAVIEVYSALPVGVPLLGYGLAGLVAHYVLQRIEEPRIPLLFLFLWIGTILVQGSAFLGRWLFDDVTASAQVVLTQIILPSMLLNSLLALPFYAIVGEWADWTLPPRELAA
ncbi:MAG: hypothetical protein GXO36_07240 [Chloroflexi bacterium]|nr:hypothetical protein [Chloroflexota bacterium]